MNFTYEELKTGDFSLKSKEDVLLATKIANNIDEKLCTKVKEAAEYLGIIDSWWYFEDYSVGENRIYVTVYDYYYDLHDTKTDDFPIECIVSEEFLKSYKEECEAKRAEAEKLKAEIEKKEQRKKELKELTRLKEKYEKEEMEL